MQESVIEKRLKKEIEKIGGKALKFVSPGMSGMPDRIVLLPDGKIFFIELKAPGKKLRALQEYRAKELRTLGFKVKVIDSIEGIDLFIREMDLDAKSKNDM
jgi:hypothetical protein